MNILKKAFQEGKELNTLILCFSMVLLALYMIAYWIPASLSPEQCHEVMPFRQVIQFTALVTGGLMALVLIMIVIVESLFTDYSDGTKEASKKTKDKLFKRFIFGLQISCLMLVLYLLLYSALSVYYCW